ncbi:hypothetical protein ACK3TF_003683 [Chlorella vulgaris]
MGQQSSSISAPLLSPWPQKGRRRVRSKGTLCWVLVLLGVGIVGFMQMRTFEARLQAALHRHRDKAVSGSSSDGQGEVAASLDKALHTQSQMCAAKLEAQGVLPDSNGLRLTAEQRQRRLRERHPRRLWQKSAVQLAREAAEDEAASVAHDALSALQARRQLYAGMEQALRDKGLALATSDTQGMALGDMFKIEGGKLRPVVTVLKVAVRAVVMPLLDQAAALRLQAAVKSHLEPLMPPNGIWMQHNRLYHSTIFHASTHMDPVFANPQEVNLEEYQIQDVGHKTCPLHLVLERIVATPSGTVLACWQIAQGTDVTDIRKWLREALPRASTKQVVNDRSILHTTLARLVALPNADQATAGQQQQQEGTDMAGAASAAAAAVTLQAAVDRMTAELCGLSIVIDKLWFVEEYEKLALALRGSFRQREIALECETVY